MTGARGCQLCGLCGRYHSDPELDRRKARTGCGEMRRLLSVLKIRPQVLAALNSVSGRNNHAASRHAELGPDLPIGEVSNGGARGPGAFEERLEVLAHDAVKERLLGLVAFGPVDGDTSHRDRPKEARRAVMRLPLPRLAGRPVQGMRAKGGPPDGRAGAAG